MASAGLIIGLILGGIFLVICIILGLAFCTDAGDMYQCAFCVRLSRFFHADQGNVGMSRRVHQGNRVIVTDQYPAISGIQQFLCLEPKGVQFRFSPMLDDRRDDGVGAKYGEILIGDMVLGDGGSRQYIRDNQGRGFVPVVGQSGKIVFQVQGPAPSAGGGMIAVGMAVPQMAPAAMQQLQCGSCKAIMGIQPGTPSGTQLMCPSCHSPVTFQFSPS